MKRLRTLLLTLAVAVSMSTALKADGTCIINDGGYMIAVDCTCMYYWYQWELICGAVPGACVWIPNPCGN